MMTAQTTIRINHDSLEEAVAEYLTAVDSMQCHIHLRIDADGNAYVSEDAGYCVSHDEYNRVPGHVRTVKHQQGHGQCHLETGWEFTEDGMESIHDVVVAIVEDLEREGLVVAWTE